MDPAVQHPAAPAGLAWTPLRSGLALVKASRVAGSGRMVLSGTTADELTDTARLALALVRSRAVDLRLATAVFDAIDVHLHVPSGTATPERAAMGLALFVALASLFSGTPVRHDVAMAGVIGERGLLLPMADLPDKLQAMQRAALGTLLLPQRNRQDVDLLPSSAHTGLRFEWLTTVDDALRAALGPSRPHAVAEAGAT